MASRSPEERLEAAFAFTRAAYIAKGYDAESLGPFARTITRVPR